MIPEFDSDGNLPSGIHWASWEEIELRFGSTPWRSRLSKGLLAALQNLAQAECQTAYIDGSFVTSKDLPDDFDACWDPRGVVGRKLDPVLLDFSNDRMAQTAKYGGELFPDSSVADIGGTTYLDFFQVDKDSGEPKGIIGIDLSVLK